MSVDERIVALKSKHHDLELAIDEENTKPYPDDAHVQILKKQKLRIKDELASVGVS